MIVVTVPMAPEGQVADPPAELQSRRSKLDLASAVTDLPSNLKQSSVTGVSSDAGDEGAADSDGEMEITDVPPSPLQSRERRRLKSSVSFSDDVRHDCSSDAASSSSLGSSPVKGPRRSGSGRKSKRLPKANTFT